MIYVEEPIDKTIYVHYTEWQSSSGILDANHGFQINSKMWPIWHKIKNHPTVLEDINNGYTVKMIVWVIADKISPTYVNHIKEDMNSQISDIQIIPTVLRFSQEGTKNNPNIHVKDINPTLKPNWLSNTQKTNYTNKKDSNKKDSKKDMPNWSLLNKAIGGDFEFKPLKKYASIKVDDNCQINISPRCEKINVWLSESTYNKFPGLKRFLDHYFDTNNVDGLLTRQTWGIGFNKDDKKITELITLIINHVKSESIHTSQD
jgi:hypothetical protein